MYVKAFIANVNKCLKPFFLEQHINSVNRVTLQSFWFICNLISSSTNTSGIVTAVEVLVKYFVLYHATAVEVLLTHLHLNNANI